MNSQPDDPQFGVAYMIFPNAVVISTVILKLSGNTSNIRLSDYFCVTVNYDSLLGVVQTNLLLELSSIILGHRTPPTLTTLLSITSSKFPCIYSIVPPSREPLGSIYPSSETDILVII